MSRIALLHVNFSFIDRALLVFSSMILIIAKPKISSANGALTFTHFFSSSFSNTSFSGYIGTDLFMYSNLQSLEFITPSNSNTFFIPKTRSIFSCISDTMCRFQICDYGPL